ncbi:hypothetical protein AAG570_011000 [Ranatra chinensis]|uniref:Diphthine--ammonia ligase n=1 Tax=Ranatra chinensis TaxID=642074 RepID=A0ABD0Z1K2_9HEMI
MKVVALISGGKDSCYNMLQCVLAGHEIVALANLKPENKDELDSFMYQTVGHQGVELYAEAMNIPLFRHPTAGIALQHEKSYVPTPEDEVEDLYQLLLNVQEQITVEAVAVGAVLSDYQRLRVENVCSRLGLVALAYLWRRDQAELLQEMIDYNIDAIIIKVAALGLDPSKHLGMRISEIQPHLIKMNIDSDAPLIERLRGCPFKTAEDYITDIDQADLTDTEPETGGEELVSVQQSEDTCPLLEIKESGPAPIKPSIITNNIGWSWIGGIVGENTDLSLATSNAVNKLKSVLIENGLNLSHLVCVCLYVRDMSEYTSINNAYLSIITGPDPPVRICLGTGLNEQTPVILSAVAYAYHKQTMHVQALSHWAPANIGPYSQAVKVADIIYVAGQIGLIPGSMTLVDGGVRRECRLALRHISRLVKAMDKDFQLRDVVLGVCFITNASFIGKVRKEWERKSNNAIVDYIVVPQLPKSALVEWQVWVHKGNTRFEYEETGCVVGENRVSIRRRWNYDNTVSVIVCYVSTATSVSNPVISELGSVGMNCETLSESQLVEVLRYSMSRLFKGLAGPSLQNTMTNSDAVLNSDTSSIGEVPTLSPTPVCSLHVYYRVGRAPSPHIMYDAIASLEEFNISATLIPVCQLNHPNAFISLCAVRYE